MAFSTLMFLFVFLPVCFLLYYLIPGKGKNPVLLLLSLVFFAWGSPIYLILLACSLVFNYFSALQIVDARNEDRPKKARFALLSAVIADLLLLGFYKYFGFFLDNLNGIWGTQIPKPQLPVPIGISFFTFSILSYLFDVYRGTVEDAGSFLEFGLYVSFFPKLVSGPIVPYHEMQRQIREHPFKNELLASGIRKFLTGLAKKLLLADALGKTFYAIQEQPLSQLTVLGAWLGAILYSLMLYFDFSGYSDMAIGLGEIFGFRFKKNFDYPYTSGSITEFWRRWHISLGHWFRDYVYIPLGGNREGTLKTVRNLLIVWLLTGIWHGANWTFVLWGIYYGLLLLLEKFVFSSILEKIPLVIRKIFTVLLVVIGWVFFFSKDVGSAFHWLGCMLGIGSAGFVSKAVLYYFGSCWLLLVFGIVGATQLPSLIGANLLRERSTLSRILSVAWFALLLAFSIAAMVSATYSSFLYFQF